MNKYVSEFIGTFFLVLTIGCTVIGHGAGPFAPLAIGSALMVMIFAGGHISGGHFNPAVTLGVWLRGKCEAKDVAPYMIFQIMGAVLAALVVKFFEGGAAVTPLHPATVPALLAEFLFTFALVYVVLNVATAKGTSGNSFYGLAIGFTVLVGRFPSATFPVERSTQRWRRASPFSGCRPGRISGFTWSLILPALRWRRARSRQSVQPKMFLNRKRKRKLRELLPARIAIRALVQILREGTTILWRRQVYAARTEFQTAGVAWPLRLRRPKANWSLRIRRSSSMPAIVVAAQG